MSLDIPERQVLVPYWEEDLPWHHRVLLVHVGNGKWIWATPDFAVQVGDVTGFTNIYVLERNGAFPQRAVDRELYAFDNPIDEADLMRMRGEAQRLGGALGAPEAAGLEGDPAIPWLFSDPSRDKFGEEVDPAKIASADTAVIRDTVALVVEEYQGRRLVI